VHDNEWGTPEQDVKRRDFTINGLFYDPFSNTIIDYVSGYEDLQKKYLRTIGQAYLRFKQDPVRMIRLIKFHARFNFEIDPEARLAMVECSSEILKSSQARIFEEILKMLESGSAEPFIDIMHEYRFLELLAPSLSRFLTLPEGEDILDLLYEADMRFPNHIPDRAVLLSCIVFPYLHKKLHEQFLSRNKMPHLGEVYEEIQNAISTLFRPFFTLPRRLRMQISSVLLSQYRMTPLNKQLPRKLKIPKDPDFPLALNFLSLRQELEPSLTKLFKEWQKAYEMIYGHRQNKRKHKVDA
jgi:poly(A) polymerase